MKTIHPLIISLILATLLPGCARRPGSQRQPTPPPAPAPLPSIVAHPAFAQGGAKRVSLPDIAERAVQSVVNIFSTRLVRQRRGSSPFEGHPFFDRSPFGEIPREQRARSLGSGVIVSRDGVVLTNNHVVEHADQIRARLSDGRELAATLVGSDPKSDLAVLRLKGELGKIQPLPVGDSGTLRLGEVVLAIGNPFGVGQTVTMGIVSALGRANMGIVDYEDFIQTDAAINPGNSGGALVNMRAELVGINTAILSKSGGYQGIGFAIPTAMARPIMESLIKHGKVIRGWLGVEIQSLTEEMAQALRLTVRSGVLVTNVVPEGPAAKAGLRREDLIIQLDGKPTDTVAHLRNAVAVAGAAATVKLTCLRGEKRLELAVKLGALPSEAEARLDSSQGALGGLTLEPLTDELRAKLGLHPRVTGVVVKEVEPGSAAQGAGLLQEDVVLEFNRRPVPNPMAFAALYRSARGKVLLLVFRQGTTMYLLLEK